MNRCLFIWITLTAFAALATGGEDGIIYVDPYLYDREGKCGLPRSSGQFTLPTNRSIEVWFPDSTEPWIDYTRLGAVGTRFPHPPGTPLLFRSKSDQTGTFAGYSALNLFYETGYPVQYLLPVNGSEVGMFVYTDEVDVTDRSVCTVSFFIAEDVEEPSLLIDKEGLSGMSTREVTVRVDYLPGNTNEHIGSQIAHRGGSVVNGALSMYWPKSGGTTLPSSIEFGTPPPVGPTMISVGIDGYTTHSIILQTDNMRAYAWGTVHEALAEDATSPVDVGIVNLPSEPPISLRTRAVLWSVSGYCDRFSNVAPHMDANGDSSTDVSDLVQLLQEESAR